MPSHSSSPAIAALACVVFAAAGCWTHRGHLTLASPHGVPARYRIVSPHVTGTNCDVAGVGSRPALERAIDDALGKAPDADVLASARIAFEAGCYRVEGAALRTRSSTPALSP